MAGTLFSREAIFQIRATLSDLWTDIPISGNVIEKDKIRKVLDSIEPFYEAYKKVIGFPQQYVIRNLDHDEQDALVNVRMMVEILKTYLSVEHPYDDLESSDVRPGML